MITRSFKSMTDMPVDITYILLGVGLGLGLIIELLVLVYAIRVEHEVSPLT